MIVVPLEGTWIEIWNNIFQWKTYKVVPLEGT